MIRRSRTLRTTATLFLAAAGSWLVPAGRADEKPAPKKPQVEVVFCLDTTGSMGGLIEGAKQKIWAISNQIASGKPTPRLKVGLVAFRDRGDAYVTRVFDLTEDLDAVYGNLKKFQAQGGGDFPESVNQALNESVTKIKWSKDKDTLRLLFLVGDAPPHMDYPDDVKYPVTCKLAREMGIIINTVQCGPHPETRKFWQDICQQGGGEYVQIAANGGVVAVATPFDKQLQAINAELSKTTLTFGDRARQLRGEAKKDAAARLPAAAAAERAAFAGKARKAAEYDLLDNIKSGNVKLEQIKKEHLPPQLQKLTIKEQKAYLEKLDKRRAELAKQAVELDRKRGAYIKEQLAKEKKGKDGFDQQVLKILQKQAKKHKIEYKD